jgi:hypothetical protein
MGNGDGCDGERGWRWISVSVALREYLPDDEQRAAAAADIVDLWQAFDDGDEAVERWYAARQWPTYVHHKDRDDRMDHRQDEPERLRGEVR